MAVMFSTRCELFYLRKLFRKRFIAISLLFIIIFAILRTYNNRVLRSQSDFSTRILMMHEKFIGKSNASTEKRDDPVAKIFVDNPVIAPEHNVCREGDRELPPCPEMPVESDKFNISREVLTFDNIYRRHGKGVSEGGHYRPAECKSDQNVAIIIPYRARETHLKMMLNNLHPFLKKQNVEYTIFVVEQLPGGKFNRGMVKNIGFFEARKMCKFDCVFFHDIDMVPDDYGNVYKCGDQPRQHSRKLKRWAFKPPYNSSFGGVVSMKSEQFIKVNGYPNTNFEWGSEDDEFGNRIMYYEMNKTSYPFDIGTYQEFSHEKSDSYYYSHLYWYPKWKSRLENDGLMTLYYSLKGIVHKPLFTHIFIRINVDLINEMYHGKIMYAGIQDIKVPQKEREKFIVNS